MIVVAEYIWLDGKGVIRSKTRTCEITSVDNVNSYKGWNYDGSSTGDAVGSDSEIILKPVAVYPDPFRTRRTFCRLVLCETYLPDGNPTVFNTRVSAVKLFANYTEEIPWYGLEQEFFIMDGIEGEKLNAIKCRSHTSKTPTGTHSHSLGQENPQGQYYCSVGYQNAFGRQVTEDAYLMALKSCIKCSGLNAEVAPGQWEIQIGPCEGIAAGDHLIILRYILQRVGELHRMQISLHPKPIKGNWNGSGCHTNFSTKKMRSEGGYIYIIEAIEKLKLKHSEHMEIYGKYNKERCSGNHETADYDTFSYGIADRGSSIRIPRETEKLGCGYFEDRRPASNMDPYLVTAKILETIMN